MKYAAIALLTLAGCGATPDVIRSDGERREVKLTLPPDRAAGCIARNAENYSQGITTATRAGPGAGTLEVAVIAYDGPFAIAEVRPGSATVWRHWRAPVGGGLVDAMGKGC